MNFNYFKICSDLIEDLSPRTKEVILRRFGLERGERETLEAIGKDFGICRERVRQIEKDGFLRLEPKLEKIQKIFQYFTQELRHFGGLKKEDILLSILGGEKWRNQIYFLLTLGPNFQRVSESDEFYSLWTINQNSLVSAKKVIDSFYNKLEKNGKPLSLKELSSFFTIKEGILISYLEISKKIQKGPDGLFGLKDWPEINPRGIKDKAYLVFKKTGKALHFTEVAKLIEGSLVQTVHNELIRDPRFVLIGRGTYALREWGYEPGEVKDVISKVLKEEGPLTKEEILEKVLKQRLVKENTVFLNLSNKKYFERDIQGKYIVREI
jgi:hypothetical protein